MKCWFLCMLSGEGAHKVRVTLLRLPALRRENRFYSLLFDQMGLPAIRASSFSKTEGTVAMDYYGMESEGEHEESRAYVIADPKPVQLGIYDPMYAFVELDDVYLQPILHLINVLHGGLDARFCNLDAFM